MVKEVEQAIIFAGGFGTRMCKYNPKHCKSLIKFNGFTMVEYLLNNLSKTKIKKVLIITMDHSKKDLIEILKKYNFDTTFVNSPNNLTITETLDYFKKYLEKKFIVLFGHHPVSELYLKNIIKKSRFTDIVATVYNNSLFPIRRPIIFICKKNKIHFENDFNKIKTNNFLYLRSPYLITKKILTNISKSRNKYTSYHIYKYQNRGGKISFIQANFPPEFDTDEEFKTITKNFPSFFTY